VGCAQGLAAHPQAAKRTVGRSGEGKEDKSNSLAALLFPCLNAKPNEVSCPRQCTRQCTPMNVSADQKGIVTFPRRP